MIRVVVSLTVVLSVSLAEAAESAAQAELAEVRVLNVMELQAPMEGDVSAASYGKATEWWPVSCAWRRKPQRFGLGGCGLSEGSQGATERRAD